MGGYLVIRFPAGVGFCANFNDWHMCTGTYAVFSGFIEQNLKKGTLN